MTTHAPRNSIAALMTLTLIAGLLIQTGCKGKERSSAAAKVDCKRLCDKTFGSCVDEVLLASGKLDAKNLALRKKIGIYPKIVKEGYVGCIKPCRDKKGRFGNGKAVNACLDIKDCKKFAACIIKLIGK